MKEPGDGENKLDSRYNSHISSGKCLSIRARTLHKVHSEFGKFLKEKDFK